MGLGLGLGSRGAWLGFDLHRCAGGDWMPPAILHSAEFQVCCLHFLSEAPPKA